MAVKKEEWMDLRRFRNVVTPAIVLFLAVFKTFQPYSITCESNYTVRNKTVDGRC